MRISEDTKLDFDDVLIVPQRSALASRQEVELEREYHFPHSNRIWTGIGIIAANMDCVGTFAMAKELTKHKMLTALHKHYSVKELIEFFSDKTVIDNVFYTVGISDTDYDKLIEVRQGLSSDFPHFLNIDVANGYQQTFADCVRKYRKEFPEAVIMAGNVVTPNITEELILSGACISKIGIGSGSCCVTRLKTGCGFSQFSAIDDCSFVAHGKPHGLICSDGGCKNSGDVAKAFAVGADFVMLGGILAGTDECQGEWIEKFEETTDKDCPKFTGKLVKDKLKFYGMASKDAQEKYDGGLGDYKSAEGKTVYVPYKGPVKTVLQDILGGIRSACTYVGSDSLKHLPRCASFIRVNSTHNRVFED